MNTIIKLKKLDDNLLFKQVEIKTGDKSIITPIKAGYPKNPLEGVNEIFRKFTLQSLNKCISDEQSERTINSKLDVQKTNSINFLHVDYADIKIPEQKHIEALSDIQYENSDIVITPIWSVITRRLNGINLLGNFINLTNKYIEIIKTLNHKGIIGTIPSRMPRQFLNKILKNYYDQGVTSFVIDFDGRSIGTNRSWIRNLFRIMRNDLDILDKTFLYSINSNEGKFMKNKKSILAKDFMSAGFGIDIIGLNHLPPRMSTEVWKRIKENRQENTFRVFNRNTYGYDKKEKEGLSNLGISNREDLKKFNSSEQHKETSVLRKNLTENNTLEPYIRTKPQVDETTIKDIKKLRSETFRR